MTRERFETETGASVPAVTADEMREIDRVAVEEVGLELLQMMENAGRNLAAHARALRDEDEDGERDGNGDGGGERDGDRDEDGDGTDPVVILAGGGGNGGGGLCAARHLVNRNVPVRVVLDRDPDELSGAAATQFRVLRGMGVEVTGIAETADSIENAGVVVDAIIGYSLRGAPRGRAKDLVAASASADAPVLSLDVPSGYDATTGETSDPTGSDSRTGSEATRETPGVAVAPDRTLTLALPKTGLDAVPGDLYLGDIAIPAAVYERVGVEYESPFGAEYWVELLR